MALSDFLFDFWDYSYSDRVNNNHFYICNTEIS